MVGFADIPEVINILSTESECRPITFTSAGASASHPATNRALYIPFALPARRRIRQLYAINGAVVSGNLNIGLYDGGLNKLVDSGSTAQSGTSTPQYLDITDTDVGPGLVYLAIVADNTTAQFFRTNPAASLCRTHGVFQQALGSIALPATATPAACASAYIPWVGMVLGRMV